MDKERKNALSMIRAFALAISFLCYSNDGKAAANYTLLIASYNGKDTGMTCNLLDHYLLADKGIEDLNVTRCIHGFSYIDGSAFKPDNLTICDVGNGETIPKNLRHADVLVLVYGGDEKEENKDTENFDNLPILHKRLMNQMFDDPLVVMLNLDWDNVTVCYEDRVEMEDKLHAKQIESYALPMLEIDRDKWIFYYAKRLGDRGDEGL
jgi:hypothetical protein